MGLIQSLIDRGHAYGAEGEILFDTASMKDYGKLSGRNLDDQRAGARVAVDVNKKNPGDFVLWKASSETEPGWDATFTIDGKPHPIRGRPGWHIECSAMSAAYLGEVFDIHGGGLDLIFPHHENEIAQSRCAHGTEVMANYWLHNGFLQVEGRKMSKSEGNFVTIHDLLHTEKFGGRKWPGEVLRLAMLMTHYREPIDFSVRRLEEAETLLNRWYRTWPDVLTIARKPTSQEYLNAFLDDLSSRTMIANMYQLTVADDVDDVEKASIAVASANILGLMQVEPSKWLKGNIDRIWVEAAVIDRLTLIAAKNWTEADRIRDELLAQGIQLKDGKDPTTGERVTTWEVKR